MSKWAEEMKGRFTLDLSSKHIGNQGAEDISQALRNDTILTAINLKKNKIGTEGAAYLSDALKYNETLEEINLRDNSIGPDGAWHISQALKNNATLTHINLEGNPTGKIGFKHFEDAIALNFTILDLHIGTELPRKYSRSLYTSSRTVLDSYLKRNKKIADCLKPIKNFDTTNLSNDGIVKCFEKLKEICQNSKVSLEEPYIAECQLLLTALTDLNDHKTKEDALECLALKFTRPLFQRAADLALAQFLFKNIFLNPRYSQQHVAIAQVLLYKLKQHLQVPALQEMIYSALNLLQFHDKKQTSLELPQLIENAVILNYDTLLRLTRSALIKCQNCYPANGEEAALLICVLKHADYHPELVTYLLQSPSFVNEFKERFPGKSFFVPVENCLLSERKNREPDKQYSQFFSLSETGTIDGTDSYLIALPARQLPAVTQEQAQRCKTEISNLNQLDLSNLMQNFEEILAKIIRCNFSKERNQDMSSLTSELIKTPSP